MGTLTLSALADRLHAFDNGMGVRVFWRWSPVEHRDFITIHFDGELPVAQYWGSESSEIFRDAVLRLRAVLENHGIKVSKKRLFEAMQVLPHTPTHIQQARAVAQQQAHELTHGRYRGKSGHGDPKSN